MLQQLPNSWHSYSVGKTLTTMYEIIKGVFPDENAPICYGDSFCEDYYLCEYLFTLVHMNNNNVEWEVVRWNKYFAPKTLKELKRCCDNLRKRQDRTKWTEEETFSKLFSWVPLIIKDFSNEEGEVKFNGLMEPSLGEEYEYIPSCHTKSYIVDCKFDFLSNKEMWKKFSVNICYRPNTKRAFGILTDGEKICIIGAQPMNRGLGLYEVVDLNVASLCKSFAFFAIGHPQYCMLQREIYHRYKYLYENIHYTLLAGSHKFYHFLIGDEREKQYSSLYERWKRLLPIKEQSDSILMNCNWHHNLGCENVNYVNCPRPRYLKQGKHDKETTLKDEIQQIEMQKEKEIINHNTNSPKTKSKVIPKPTPTKTQHPNTLTIKTAPPKLKHPNKPIPTTSTKTKTPKPPSINKTTPSKSLLKHPSNKSTTSKTSNKQVSNQSNDKENINPTTTQNCKIEKQNPNKKFNK